MAKIKGNNTYVPEGIRRDMTTLLARELAKHIDFMVADDVERDIKVVCARVSLPSTLEVTQLFTSEFYETFPD